MPDARGEIEKMLQEVNGKRRERTLGYEDVIAAILEATTPGHTVATRDGGEVPNSYKYRAYSSALLVWNDGEQVHFAVETASAKRGACKTIVRRLFAPGKTTADARVRSSPPQWALSLPIPIALRLTEAYMTEAENA